MVKGEIPEHKLAGLYEPMINLILQGGKTMNIGDRTLSFDPASYFVITVDVPATGVVRQGGPGNPYLAVSLTLRPEILADLLTDLPPAGRSGGGFSGAYSVCPVTPELLDAWVRLLRLMRSPQDIPALAPAYEREILYRVLQGPQGWLLRDIGTPDSTLSQIRRSIQEIRDRYAEPVTMEDLAGVAAMGLSTFHRRFKAATGLSPLQFQKQIRLLQARTLLVAGSGSATEVAFEVGYESSSQFSREYARAFGLPPAKDAARVRRKSDQPVCPSAGDVTRRWI
jgi:AraC-like DNA-binding protein